MVTKMTVNDRIYSNANGAKLGVNYLSKEDKVEIPRLVEILIQYYKDGNDAGVVNTAKLITCEERRNQKIEQHEKVISQVIELIFNSTWTGDYITADSVADYCYFNGITGQSKHGGKTFPCGAVRIAINRLVARGVLVPADKFVRTRCDNISSCKVFKRV